MKLTDNIHLLKHDFEISLAPDQKIPRFVNSLIIFNKSITLVDTGVKGCEADIFKAIESCGRDISDIGTIILSHAHPDHIGSVAAIKRATGCKVFAHSSEKDWIEDIHTQVKMRPVPGFFELVDESVNIDGFLTDGQVFEDQDGISFKIIHSPGHSAGSINILFPDDRILFSADSIPVKNDIPNYDDYNDLKRSFNAIKTSQDYSVLLTSWTPPLTSPQEIRRVLDDGETYLDLLDHAVKENYTGNESSSLEFCSRVIKAAGLPEYYINPIVDKAFWGHIK